MNSMRYKSGSLCYINFNNSIGGEINKVHLAVVFNIPGVDNVLFVIPLTSPKEKHFKSKKAFEEINYLETKFFRLHYIKQTDSIALLEQMKSIAKVRIIAPFRDLENNNVILSSKEMEVLKIKIKKYINYILK